jgi:protein-tyrosine phosphatase
VSQMPSRPHSNCYWLPGQRVIAGEYPFNPDPAKARAKITRVLDSGVTTFIDLTEARELLPYEAVARDEAISRGLEVTHRRLPIRDNDVATPERMAEILDEIAAAESAGSTVYLHCWGGVGRTGMVVGCYLVRQGMTGDEALAEVATLFSTMTHAKTHRHRHTGSPQTEPQRQMVRRWAELDPGPSTRTETATDRRASQMIATLLQEHGSAGAALRAIEEIEQREKRELSVMERFSGPLGAQAAREETKRQLHLLAADELETLLPERPVAHAGSGSAASADALQPSAGGEASPGEEETYEVDIDAILRELSIESGQALLPVVRAALDERSMRYEVDEAHSRVTFRIKADDAVLECFVVCHDRSGLVRCYIRPSVWVPAESRMAISEAITRANYNLAYGNFELDLGDGELRFKASIDVEGGELVTTMVHNLIGAGVTMYNQYHPAFMRVIYGGISPQQAIEEVEV